jgi:hypothetical protein
VPSWVRGGLLVATIGAAACAPRLTKLPSGPGTPAADALDALDSATRSCRAIRDISAEIAVRGKIDGDRVRVRLLVGLAAPASARIEATAPFGAPLFILAGVNDAVTLLFPRDNRVLERGALEETLAALTGLPLSAEELRVTLTGCWPAHSVVRRAVQHGPEWRQVFVEPDHVVWLHHEQAAAAWRLIAVLRNVEHSGRRWVAQYGDFQTDAPHTIHIASADSESAGTYDLTLSLSQVDINPSLGPEVFRVDVPPDAERITIADLRRSGAVAPAKPRGR